VKREFFEKRIAAAEILRDQTIEPRQAVREHPELAGTHLNLHAAELAARALHADLVVCELAGREMTVTARQAQLWPKRLVGAVVGVGTRWLVYFIASAMRLVCALNRTAASVRLKARPMALTLLRPASVRRTFRSARVQGRRGGMADLEMFASADSNMAS
jgi:hypothetical protein